MQLFITDNFHIDGKNIIIRDERILHQCAKVLRYQPGDQITIQSQNTRYLIQIEWLDRNNMQWTIIWNECKPSNWKAVSDKSIIVAMTNKWDKMEMVCQKVTEIGVSSIGIWISKRSIITVISANKLERLQSIVIEAAEQSRNREVPEIKIYTKINQLPQSYLAYQEWNGVISSGWSILGSIVIWPEGGFDPGELEYFQKHHFPFIALGDTILRTETAAIVWARCLKNQKNNV